MYSNGIIVRVVGWIMVCILVFPTSSASIAYTKQDVVTIIYTSEIEGTFKVKVDDTEMEFNTGFLFYRVDWVNPRPKEENTMIGILFDTNEYDAKINQNMKLISVTLNKSNLRQEPKSEEADSTITFGSVYGNCKLKKDGPMYTALRFDFDKHSAAIHWITTY